MLTPTQQWYAAWNWMLPDGRRQMITMTFWAFGESNARSVAHTWWDRACPEIAADFTLVNLH